MTPALQAASRIERMARQGAAGLTVRCVVDGEKRDRPPLKPVMGPKRFTRVEVAAVAADLLKQQPMTTKQLHEAIGCPRVTLFYALEDLRVAKAVKVIGKLARAGAPAFLFGLTTP